MGAWGQSSQQGAGAEVGVRGKAPLKLKNFWFLDI